MPDRLLTGEPTSRHYRALLAAFAVVVLFTVMATLVILLSIAAQNKRNGDRLIDCTTPNHACYEVGRKQTGNAVSDLTAANIAAIACAEPPGEQTYPEIQVCVHNTLIKAGVIKK